MENKELTSLRHLSHLTEEWEVSLMSSSFQTLSWLQHSKPTDVNSHAGKKSERTKESKSQGQIFTK